MQLNETVFQYGGLTATCTTPPDATTQQINRHIALVCGSVRPGTATPVDQSLDSLGWVPPPFFDVNKIKNPAQRAMWQQSDTQELDGLIEDKQCVLEVPLSSAPPYFDLQSARDPEVRDAEKFEELYAAKGSHPRIQEDWKPVLDSPRAD